jgi:hypothetical protein
MKRRSFLHALSAIGLAPALPAAPAARAGAGAVAISDYMLSVATFDAQINGGASPAALSKALSIGPDTAQALQRRLIREGLLHAPDASGAARLANPFARTKPAPLKRLREVWDRVPQDDPMPNPEPQLPESTPEETDGQEGETRPPRFEGDAR